MMNKRALRKTFGAIGIVLAAIGAFVLLAIWLPWVLVVVLFGIAAVATFMILNVIIGETYRHFKYQRRWIEGEPVSDGRCNWEYAVPLDVVDDLYSWAREPYRCNHEAGHTGPHEFVRGGEWKRK